MRVKSVVRVLALVALACVVVAPLAAKDKKKGKKGAAVARPVVGTIDEISDKQITLKVRQLKKKQAGGDAQTVTVTLEDQTKYREVAQGTDQDVAAGVYVAIAGVSAEDKMTARAILTYKPDTGEEPAKSAATVQMAGSALAAAARAKKGERGQAPVVGVVESVNPLVVTARSKDGEKKITVTPDAGVRYVKLGVVERTALQKGRRVAVLPTQPVAAGTLSFAAASVVQFPEAPAGGKKGKKAGGAAAPVQ